MKRNHFTVNPLFCFTILAPLQVDAVSTSLALDDDFDDEEAWDEIKKQSEGKAKDTRNDDDDSDDDSDVTISDIFPLVSSTPPAHQKKNDGGNPGQTADIAADCMMASTPPTSALVTKLFPQLKPKMKAGVRTKRYMVSIHVKSYFCGVFGRLPEISENLVELVMELVRGLLVKLDGTLRSNSSAKI